MMDLVPENLLALEDVNSRISRRIFSESEITSYQIVSFKKRYSIEPVRCHLNAEVFNELTSLFRMRLLPKHKDVGALVLFSLPDGCEIPFQESYDGETFCDGEARVRFWLTKYSEEGRIWLDGTQIYSDIQEVLSLIELLKNKGYLSVSVNPDEGKLLFIPVSSGIGFLSNHYQPDRIVLNSHFFLIELSDLETKYDIVGEPFGLLLVDGEIVNPPLYDRTALFVDKKGNSRCRTIGIRNVPVKIGTDLFENSINARFYVRPEESFTPINRGTDIAIVGKRIVGYKTGGNLEIPEAGFVIHLDRDYIPDVRGVAFVNNTGFDFGIQVGPLLMNSNKPAEDFEDPYYNGIGPAYPPTVYPTDWHKGRAARMGFGMRDGAPVFIWVEGSKPEIYREGEDSLGFSLSEFAGLAKDEGIDNFINLDGGGSSQMAVGLQRMMRISDRYESSGEDFERPVPLGLSINCHR